jgi:Dihydrofolate reductase
LKEILKNYNSDDIFLIGGGSMYEQLLPMCQKAYITKADADGNADVFFRNLDTDKNWRCISVSDTYNTNGIDIVFCEYENLNPII